MSHDPPRHRLRAVPSVGRYEPASEGEAAAMGRALLAQIRGEPLSASERALLARARSNAIDDAAAPTPVLDVDETLLVLERGEDAELRIGWRRYKGSAPFLDLRRWERRDGAMHPTRQGITLRARELSRVLTVLVQAAAKMAQPEFER